MKTQSRLYYILLLAIFALAFFYRWKMLGLSLIEEENLAALQIQYLKLNFAAGYHTLEYPILVYLAGWLGNLIFGQTALALRIVPFLAGLACIPLAVGIGRTAVNRWVGLLAGGLVAVNAPMAFFSGLIRPYSLQFCLTLLALWLALKIVVDYRPYQWFVFVPLALIAPLAAYPAVFIFAGGAGLFGWLILTRQRTERSFVIGTGALAAVLAVQALVLLIPGLRWLIVPPGIDFVTGFFNDMLWPQKGWLTGAIYLIKQVPVTLMHWLPFAGQDWVALPFVYLTLFVALVGLSRLWTAETGRPVVVFLIATLLAQSAAMVVGKWSLILRHSIYLLPFYLACVAVGLYVVGRWLIENRYWLALGLGVLLLAILPVRAVSKSPASNLYYETGYNSFISALKTDLHDGDALFIDHISAGEFVYSYFPRRLDLIARLYQANRTWWPLMSPPRAVDGEWLTALGRRVWVVLGGADSKPLLEAKSRRIWVYINPKVSNYGPAPSLAADLSAAGYRPVKDWRPQAPLRGGWVLYERT